MLYNGTDFSTFLTDSRGVVSGGDMDTSFTPITGARACLETVARKLSCPPGSVDDPAWGIDLRGYIGASMTSRQLTALGQQVRSEILREEYVADADVVCLQDQAGALFLDVTLQLADLESYSLALRLTADSVSVVLGA